MSFQNRLVARLPMIEEVTRATLACALLIAACGGISGPNATGAKQPHTSDFPDIIEASATMSSDGSYEFKVTVSSPYDNVDRYADAWRVKGEDGTVYGIRELLHAHANEQPFQRWLAGVVIPADVTTVIVEGRDLVNGWGGNTIAVELPPSK